MVSSDRSISHSAVIKGGWDGRPIICRWRHSLLKHLKWHLLAYTFVYLVINLLYRCVMSQAHQDNFEEMTRIAKSNIDGSIGGKQLTFILGLYIGLVVKRWWDQYTSMPWPDDLALHLRACVTGGGDDKLEKRRKVRRTIIRYCLVSFILAIRRQSWRLQKRFGKGTVDDIVKTGLLDQDEMKMMKYEEEDDMYTSRWWVPIQWCMEILADAEHDKLVVNPPAYASLVSQVRFFKQGLQKVKAYGNLPVPLVYSQVVTLAVYVYFLVALIGDQYLISDEMGLFKPFFLLFKFLFYYGLLSVANCIYNPWGTDDEDFELNKLLERHLKVALAIVDDTSKAPALREDKFWNISEPKMLDNYDEDNGCLTSMKESFEWVGC